MESRHIEISTLNLSAQDLKAGGAPDGEPEDHRNPVSTELSALTARRAKIHEAGDNTLLSVGPV